MISIRLDREGVEVGEFITGRVFWSEDADRRKPRRLIIAAVWETEGEGNPVRGVARATEFVPRGAEATIPFRLMIPHEGPVTFRTQLTGVVWKLRVRADRAGFDQFEDVSFRVSPRRR